MDKEILPIKNYRQGIIIRDQRPFYESCESVLATLFEFQWWHIFFMSVKVNFEVLFDLVDVECKSFKFHFQMDAYVIQCLFPNSLYPLYMTVR